MEKLGALSTIEWYLNNKPWWETIISGEYVHYYEKMYGNRCFSGTLPILFGGH